MPHIARKQRAWCGQGPPGPVSRIQTTAKDGSPSLLAVFHSVLAVALSYTEVSFEFLSANSAPRTPHHRPCISFEPRDLVSSYTLLHWVVLRHLYR
ncbi:hypothetical protein FKP32DRAFT_1595684 [Trametes sanguinea]|nr:hypothetical protein FKP32DRAFT_1595684 [Trametes sanguinea]